MLCFGGKSSPSLARDRRLQGIGGTQGALSRPVPTVLWACEGVRQGERQMRRVVVTA
jgi:hypothetical protein